MDFVSALKNETNYTLTWNGGLTHKSTMNAILDFFAFGGSMRNASEADIIAKFDAAFNTDNLLAVRTLFYLRDIRGGQGERRLFKICFNYLAKRHPLIARQLFDFIPEFGRFDDFYCLVDTPLENDMFAYLHKQFIKDLLHFANGETYEVSLLAKWLCSCNASSRKTKRLGQKTRKAFNLSEKDYRKLLSSLRSNINIVEKQMTEQKWEDIKYEALPSKAGLVYSKAFYRHDEDRYSAFISSKKTKVNAKTLYPYEIVQKATNKPYLSETEKNTLQKYWEGLTDYFENSEFDGIAVIDTSYSMTCAYNSARPIDVAISLGLYCADKCKAPFKDHFITFSHRPELIEVPKTDIVTRAQYIYEHSLIDDTNIEAVFNLLLDTAINYNCTNEDIPKNIIIISDMQFNAGCTGGVNEDNIATLMEKMVNKWQALGYQMPHLIYWNVNASHQVVPDRDPSRPISYVSGFSPSIFQQLMSGKTGWELCIETINSERYSKIIF